MNWWDRNLNNPNQLGIFISAIGDVNDPFRVYAQQHILKNYKSVLECGAGPCIEYPVYKDKIKYQALDFADIFNELANKNQIPMLQGSIEDIPLPSNSFEVVYSRAVLEHLESYKKAITEMIRVAQKEVLNIFFQLTNSEQTVETVIDSVYHNFYSIHEISKFVLGQNKVENIQWFPQNEEIYYGGGHIVLHIFLKEDTSEEVNPQNCKSALST